MKEAVNLQKLGAFFHSVLEKRSRCGCSYGDQLFAGIEGCWSDGMHQAFSRTWRHQIRHALWLCPEPKDVGTDAKLRNDYLQGWYPVGMPVDYDGSYRSTQRNWFGHPIHHVLLILQDKLRGELGYQNIIITDAMEMGAITQQYNNADAAVGCIQAGVDIVLGPQNFPDAFDAVVKAVKEGKISEERINQSVRRILRLKAKQQL